MFWKVWGGESRLCKKQAVLVNSGHLWYIFFLHHCCRSWLASLSAPLSSNHFGRFWISETFLSIFYRHAPLCSTPPPLCDLFCPVHLICIVPWCPASTWLGSLPTVLWVLVFEPWLQIPAKEGSEWGYNKGPKQVTMRYKRGAKATFSLKGSKGNWPAHKAHTTVYEGVTVSIQDSTKKSCQKSLLPRTIIIRRGASLLNQVTFNLQLHFKGTWRGRTMLTKYDEMRWDESVVTAEFGPPPQPPPVGAWNRYDLANWCSYNWTEGFLPTNVDCWPFHTTFQQLWRGNCAPFRVFRDIWWLGLSCPKL